MVARDRKLTRGAGSSVGRGAGGVGAEMEGNAGDNDSGTKKQRAFEHEAGLIVQEVVPPAIGNEFGKENGEFVTAADGLHFVNKAEQGTQYGAIGRFEYNQRDIIGKLFPASQQFVSDVAIGADVDGDDVFGDGLGIFQRDKHNAVGSGRNGDQNSVTGNGRAFAG